MFGIFLKKQSTINHQQSTASGFTLVELLVGIAVLGLVASTSVVVMNPGKQLDRSRDTQRQKDIKQIKTAIEVYYQDNKCFPQASAVPPDPINPDSQAFLDALSSGGDWKDPNNVSALYMKKVPKDPSGASYIYKAENTACPQWMTVFSDLAQTSPASNPCPIPTYAKSTACVPEGFDQTWACASSGTITCAAPSPTATTIPTATLTPTATTIPTPTLSPTATLTPTATLAPTPTTAPGPVAWWKLDETSPTTGAPAYDNSGNNITGSATGTTVTTGRFAGARSFNGSSEFIAVGDRPILRLATNLTISTWFKTTTTTASSNIIRKDTISAGTRYLWGIMVNSTTCSGTNKASAIYYNGAAFCINSTVNVNDGLWHNAVLTLSGTTMRFYVDGVKQGSDVTVTGTMAAPPDGELDIGASPPYSSGARSQYFNGTIDDTRIYNYALNQTQISDLYTSPTPSPTPSPQALTCPANYLASWKLNEGSAPTTAYDATVTNPYAGGIVGTINGATVVPDGKLYRARSFDGVDDYMVAPVNGTALTATTVAFWYKPLSNSGTKGVFQWANGADIGSTQFPFILIQNNNGALRYYVDQNYRASTTVTVGTWYHVAVRVQPWGGQYAWDFYINGSPVGTQYYGGLYNRVNATGVYLGVGYNGYAYGVIDELSVWNRTLSSVEISNLYNGGSGLDCFAPQNVNETINPKPVVINESREYRVVLTGTDVNGGDNINVQAGMINYHGPSAGQYRGYFAWMAGDYWAGVAKNNTRLWCTNGGDYDGFAAVYGLDYNPEYIDILSCSTSVIGNVRESTLTFRLNQGGGWPAVNTLSSYTTDDVESFDTWESFETFNP